jgi:hypothetical protein
MSKGDALVTVQEICKLESTVNRYLAAAIDLSSSARTKFAGLSQKMAEGVAQVTDLLENDEYS